jgi:hypothetical protein
MPDKGKCQSNAQRALALNAMREAVERHKARRGATRVPPADWDMSEVLGVGIDQAYLNGIALAALELFLALFLIVSPLSERLVLCG